MARLQGSPFRPVLCYCSDVDTLKERLHNRDVYVPDWTPAGWEEVERIKSYFEMWPEGSAIRLDSLLDFEHNLSRALEWIDTGKLNR